VARVEFQGRDISEAIAQAAGALNLPPETLKFQVTDMGAKGFLGLGRRKARIAVDPDDPTLDMDDAPAPGGEESPAAPAEPERQGGYEALALAVIREILGHMDFSAEAACEYDGDSLIVSLDGPDNALLIGSRGATLEALQLLASKILARRLAAENPETDSRVRLVVDVAGYRARRQRHLLDTLQTLAQEVRRTRRPQTVSGLSAAERRMLQAALRPHKDLGVRSGGRDSLVIIPAHRRAR
jgi:spoIIIJ-associated protein